MSSSRTAGEAADLTIRAASPADLPEIAAIDHLSPEGAHWTPAEYLKYECRVAISGGSTAGYVVWRSTAKDEREILALAVHPAFRRRKVGTALLHEIVQNWTGTLYLEMRETNDLALRFYEEYGFRKSGYRKRYYSDTGEGAIVLRLQPC